MVRGDDFHTSIELLLIIQGIRLNVDQMAGARPPDERLCETKRGTERGVRCHGIGCS
jgi:hypothetical protein